MSRADQEFHGFDDDELNLVIENRRKFPFENLPPPLAEVKDEQAYDSKTVKEDEDTTESEEECINGESPFSEASGNIAQI